ncbi:hypothetical protein BKA93DRAFT_762388 [Sparassis latifolia]
MCGRFSLGIPHHQIQELHGYNVQVGEWIGQEQFVPRHNIAPRSQAPVLRRREHGEDIPNAPSDALIIQTMKWGLVPHWSKHEDNRLNTVNARCENLIEGGGMWASIKGKRRCAVICEGYFEWLKKGAQRLPHFTKHRNGSLMLLAGLYDRVVLEGQTEPLWTFTVVTTDASKEFEWLHDRQPVILPSMEALNTWLNTSPQRWTPELTKVVQPYHNLDSPLLCYQVPKEVGKVGTESPSFIEPLAERKDGIQAMFARQQEGPFAKVATPTKKRKRSASPQPGSSKKVESPAEHGVKAEAEKINAWDDDSDIEYVDSSKANEEHGEMSKVSPAKSHAASIRDKSSPKKATPQKAVTKTLVSEKPTAKKQKKTSKPDMSTKITTFFAKS